MKQKKKFVVFIQILREILQNDIFNQSFKQVLQNNVWFSHTFGSAFSQIKCYCFHSYYKADLVKECCFHSNFVTVTVYLGKCHCRVEDWRVRSVKQF